MGVLSRETQGIYISGDAPSFRFLFEYAELRTQHQPAPQQAGSRSSAASAETAALFPATTRTEFEKVRGGGRRLLHLLIARQAGLGLGVPLAFWSVHDIEPALGLACL
jgi:hypothetical protein